MIPKKIPTSHLLLTRLLEHAAWLLNTRVLGADGLTSYHRTHGKSYAKRSIGFGEYAGHMLPTKGPQQGAMGQIDANRKRGYIVGYVMNSDEYCSCDEESTKMVLARSMQRVPLDQRWKAEGLENMNVPCHQLYNRQAARAVHVEGFAEDPKAKQHEVGTVKIQRVWIYKADYKNFGITDNCKKCIHIHKSNL